MTVPKGESSAERTCLLFYHRTSEPRWGCQLPRSPFRGQSVLSGLFLCAVQRKFAVNTSAGEAIVIPCREESFPASRTTNSVAAPSDDAEANHPGNSKYEDRLLGLEEFVR